jgi:hypothetical protein
MMSPVILILGYAGCYLSSDDVARSMECESCSMRTEPRWSEGKEKEILVALATGTTTTTNNNININITLYEFGSRQTVLTIATK